MNPPEDVNSSEFEQWELRCLARTLYDNPLGSDHTIRRYWSSPAEQLGLPLIAAIYNAGLRVGGADLLRLEEELNRLERQWATMDFSGEQKDRGSAPYEDGSIEAKEITDLDHLRERSGYLREAIRIARASDGIVGIS